MLKPAFTSFALLFSTACLLACSSGNTGSGVVPEEPGSPEGGADAGSGPTPPVDAGPPPLAPGKWTKLEVPGGEGVDVNAIFAPRPDLAFFGTSAGMLRFDGKALAKVDLGCTGCTVEDFDRDSGLALGSEGAQVYAGVFDGKDGYKPFAWKTPRTGPKPRRAWGDGSSFVYAPVSGNKTVRYDPTAILGSPSFGPEANGGDMLLYGDTPLAVWGLSVGYYWVAAGRGMYSHQDNYKKVTEDDFTFLDVWGKAGGATWALRADNFLMKYAGGVWATHTKIETTKAGAARFIIVGDGPEAWLLGTRADGGAGTGASPVTYGAAIGHVKGTDQKWVEFPKNLTLKAFAVSDKEAWAAGPKGALYRCVQPGCDVPASAPQD